MPLRPTFAMVLLLALTANALAQQPVPVGKGSYAEFPPPTAGKGAAEMIGRKFPLVDPTDRPIPTNKLWTALLDGKAAGALWMYPWRVDPKPSGVEMFLPIKWQANGSDPVCDAPLKLEGIDFHATGLQVKNWGDWTLTFRLPESASRYLDVTVGEGMPIVWIEPHGVQLRLKAAGKATFGGSLPMVISAAGRQYGVYAPQGSRVISEGDAVRIDLPQAKAFVAVAALKEKKDLDTFARPAQAIPRDSRVAWKYDPRGGKVTTTWTVTSDRPDDVVAQGWLPHHWRDTEQQLTFVGPEYLTPRGTLKTTVGNRFQIIYDFEGFLPDLPAPAKLGLPHDFDRERMAYLLARSAKNPKYGDDSYWGGKDLLRFAQYLQMAKELKDPSYAKHRDEAHAALADWLTYTPGESAHYFTHYKNWHALIGIKDSYDSARFNDQHFHYGYFALSTALLAMEEPAFLKDYGPMIRLVAKQYANWDRGDTRFPFLRTLDVWAGHSWAGGLRAPGGNNQESTSEAMQSWIGLYLLGTMLDDADMTAAAALGYAMESRATLEYWFNLHGDILPVEYKHPVVGVLWSGGQVFGTYFSGDPAWVYGIQCLPQSPGLDYLVRDPAFARKLFKEILVLRKAKEGTNDLARMGDLGNVLLAQASLADPEWAAREFDRLWDANSPIVREHFGAGTTYYNAHAYRRLGERRRDVRLSLPTAAVYYNQATRVATFAAYNPKPYPVVVEARKGEKVLGTFVAPPRQLHEVHKLDPAGSQVGLAGSLPGDGDRQASRRTNRLYVLFYRPAALPSLAGVHLEGPGDPKVTCTTEDEGRVLVCTLAEPLTPGASYRLIVPAGVKQADGTTILDREQAIVFTVEPQPPLALEATVPADGQDHVDTVQPELLLSFNAPLDPKTLGRIRLQGPDTPAIQSQAIGDGAQVKITPAAPLQADATYTLSVPTGMAARFGGSLATPRTIRFSTRPAACPPNVYRESFAGGGFAADDSLAVDLRNTESPHSGKYAIKLQAGKKDGTVYFFAGSSDHGDGRKPLDLSAYDRLEFWMKGPAEFVWAKIGHPVFDNHAFQQARLTGITGQYRRYALDIPSPKTAIGTLFVISVPAGQTLYLDDIRFVNGGQ